MQVAGLDDAESEAEGVYEHNVTGWFYIYFEKRRRKNWGCYSILYDFIGKCRLQTMMQQWSGQRSWEHVFCFLIFIQVFFFCSFFSFLLCNLQVCML